MCVEGDRPSELGLDTHSQTDAVPKGKHSQPWLLQCSMGNETPAEAKGPCLRSGLSFGGDCQSNSLQRASLPSSTLCCSLKKFQLDKKQKEQVEVTKGRRCEGLRDRGMSHTGLSSRWLCCDLHTSLGYCCDHPCPCVLLQL